MRKNIDLSDEAVKALSIQSMPIKPTKTFTDEKGNWWIEFKSDELKIALEKFKPKKKKIWWKFWS